MKCKKESFNYQILSICPLNTCLHLTFTRKSQILFFFIAGQNILILTSTAVATAYYLSSAGYGKM
jgi:hypothetical protein